MFISHEVKTFKAHVTYHTLTFRQHHRCMPKNMRSVTTLKRLTFNLFCSCQSFKERVVGLRKY